MHYTDDLFGNKEYTFDVLSYGPLTYLKEEKKDNQKNNTSTKIYDEGGRKLQPLQGMILNYPLTCQLTFFKRFFLKRLNLPLRNIHSTYIANCAVHHYYHTLLQVAITLFYLHMSISPFNLSKINLSLL